MRNKRKRIGAFLLAVVVLITTCLADLPEGSLSFLGNFGDRIVSALSNEEVQAAVATTTKFSLPSAYSSASISEIGRYSEGMWFFECKSDTGSKKTVFCMNSGKSLHTSDTYKYTTTSAVKYSNQSLAKAMTWWFGATSRGCVAESAYNNGSSYGSLTEKQTHAAVQAYVWASCTDGASKETTVKQVLKNYCGLSEKKAASYAKSIVSAINGTYVYGTIYYYTLKSCGKNSTSTHQTMLSWSPSGTVVKTGTYNTSDSKTGSVTITIEINKKDKPTGELIDTAVFKVIYGEKKLANAKKVSISNGSITSATVDVTTGEYDSDTSRFTTSGGKVKFTFTVEYKTNKYTTQTYKYVKNWNDLDYWTQKEYTDAGYYQNLSKAQSAAQKELKSGLEKYVSSVKSSIRSKSITVEEKTAPKGHGLSATSKLSKTAKDTLSLTYNFSNPAKYGKVTVVKKEGDTSGYDKDYSPMKGAVYGVYAAETIYDTDNSTVLYKKNEKITEITTNSKGTASTKKILPVGYDYYVKEISAPEGWKLDTQKHEFSITVDSDGNVESATVTSKEDHDEEMKYGYVSVMKSAKRSAAYISDDATLAGATYTVYAAETIYDVDGEKVLYKSGAKVTSFSTNENGYGKSAEVIPAGESTKGYKYYLVETQAPTGYVVNTEKLYFYVRVDSEGTVTVKDENGNAVNGAASSGKTLLSADDSIWGYVAVNKYTQDMDQTTNKEAGAVFYIVKYEAVLTATAASNLTRAKAAIREMTAEQRQDLIRSIQNTDASAIKEMLTTNADGYAKSGVLPKGKYMLIQTSGTQGYDLEQYYFAISKDSGKTYTYDIYNKQRASIRITKTKSSRDESGNYVEEAEEGAVFYVLYASQVSHTLSELNAMDAAARQSYVAGLDASAIYARLITDENGEASTDVDTGTSYIILQTYGDPYCALAYPDEKTFAANEAKTYSYDATNPEPHTKFSITKTLADTLGQYESAEEGAAFALIKADAVTKTAVEINAMTASERKAYVTELEETDSTCILATLTTDSNGRADYYWNDSDYMGEFVVIQTYGVDGYALMPVLYSMEATSDGSGGTVMKKETGTDSDGLDYTYYSFSCADKYGGGKSFSVAKRLSDAKGNDEGTEEGARFAIIKSAYVTLSEDEINAMTQDERIIYVNGLKSADETCILGEITTDSEGDASVAWTNQSYDGEFVVIQTEGTDGYSLMEVMYSEEATETGLDVNGNVVLTVSTDGRTVFYSISYSDQFENWGKIAVQKKYEAGNGVWRNEAGAKFAVLNEEGEEVAWVTTDSTGYGVALDADGSEAALAFGIYYVRQTAIGTDAGNTEFAEDELVILTQSERRQTVLYESLNPAKDYKLTITKLSDDTGAPVADATYTIKAAADILASDGSVDFKKGATVAIIETDENGQGSTWIPYGYYCIEESESPYNFVLDMEKVYFTIDASGITVSGGQTSAAVFVTETDEDGNETSYYAVSYTTYDTPVYGRIYVTKDGPVLEDVAKEGGFTYYSKGLEGAVYALYARADITDDAGNIIWKAGEYITSATTDGNGMAQFFWDKDKDGTEECEDFYLGDYYIVETGAPEGYTIDKEEHDITLTWDKTPGEENELADAGSVGDTGEAYGASVPYESSGKYVLVTGIALNDLIQNAVTVTFTWSSPASGITVTDVSHDGDGSVVMWNDGAGNYYISTKDIRQAVIFNGNSSHMFDNCRSLEEIRFDSVDTSKTCDMSYMFYMCSMLVELDLTYFDTTNVEVFDYMFGGCTSLVTIYVTDSGSTGTNTESVYHTDTWTTGVTAEANGAVLDGDAITWENFSYTRLYTADYIAEEVQEDVTLSASDITSVTPSVASQDDKSLVWVNDYTYTVEAVITLSQSCAYYCKDGTYSNTLYATVTVEIPHEIDIETTDLALAELAVSDTPITVSINVYKEDESGNALEGAIFTLYANCDIVNADGDIIAEAGDAIAESESLGEKAPVLTFSGLPMDMYAVKGTYLATSGSAVYCYADGTTGSRADGQSMFYVRETTAPAGYETDGKTYYLTGALSDYDGAADEKGDGVITYTFTAVNTKLFYLTLQKAWNDSGNSGRPDYVIFLARASGKSSYVIVMYEDRTYLFSYDSVGAMIYSTGNVQTAYLSYALCYWNTTVSTEGSGASAVKVWSAVLNRSFTVVNSSGFSSPFSTDSGYVFLENATVLKNMTVNGSGDEYYYPESEGWTNMAKNVWRTTNYIAPENTDSEVLKYWEDNENKLQLRPKSIQVVLYQKDSSGNVKQMLVRTLSEENDWSYSTADDSTVTLKKYDAKGKEYTYYWGEATAQLPNGYTLTDTKSYFDNVENVWYTQLTNTIVSSGKITVYKTILADDIDWSAGEPSFTFTLTASNGYSMTKTLTFTRRYVKKNTDTDGYVTVSGTFTGLSYGTYTLAETQMPEDWVFLSLKSSSGSVSGETVRFTISSTNIGESLEATFENECVRKGTITIIKYETDGETVLAGVTFAISNEDGEIVDTQVTDERGQVVFEELEPGTYHICETATVSGYSLLAEEITATIPLVLSQQDLDAYKEQGIVVDTSDAVVRNGEYYFYELTYEVTDTWEFDVPLAGESGTMPRGWLLTALLMIFAALLIWKKEIESVKLKEDIAQREISCAAPGSFLDEAETDNKVKNHLLFSGLWGRMGILYCGGQRYFGRFNRGNKKAAHFCHYFASGCG